MSSKREMSVSGNIVPKTWMEICAVWPVAPSRWNHSKSCWQGCNSLRRTFSGTTLYRSAFTVTVRPSAFLKGIRTNNAMIINITPHLSLLHWAEYVDEVHVVCLEPNSDTFVYSHNQTYGSEPHLTLVMCAICRYCFSPVPRIHCKTVVGSHCPVH